MVLKNSSARSSWLSIEFGGPFSIVFAFLLPPRRVKRRLGGRPCQGRQPPGGGGRRPTFTGPATQPYSATEVDGWLQLFRLVAIFCMQSHRPDQEQEIVQRSTTRSARGCHPCLRYNSLPMSPGRTKDKLIGVAGFEPATPSSRKSGPTENTTKINDLHRRFSPFVPSPFTPICRQSVAINARVACERAPLVLVTAPGLTPCLAGIPSS
jgi:hypothetical protein